MQTRRKSTSKSTLEKRCDWDSLVIDAEIVEHTEETNSFGRKIITETNIENGSKRSLIILEGNFPESPYRRYS